MARTVPAKALELAAYDALKRALRGWRWGEGGRQVLPDSLVGGLSGGLAGGRRPKLRSRWARGQLKWHVPVPWRRLEKVLRGGAP